MCIIIYIYIYLGSGIRTCEDEEFDAQSLMWETLLYIIYICMYPLTLYIPLAIWGGCWDPRFSRGPQGQAPRKSLLNQSLLSRVGCYLLQNQEPSTEKISDKANSCFLQNQ